QARQGRRRSAPLHPAGVGDLGGRPGSHRSHQRRGNARMDNHSAEAVGGAMSGVMSGKLENSVDATRGQPLAARVLARKDELEDALAELGPHETIERQAIETALA